MGILQVLLVVVLGMILAAGCGAPGSMTGMIDDLLFPVDGSDLGDLAESLKQMAETTNDTPVSIVLNTGDAGSALAGHEITALPEHGTLKDANGEQITSAVLPYTLDVGAGTVTYVPDPEYVGSDSFSFYVEKRVASEATGGNDSFSSKSRGGIVESPASVSVKVHSKVRFAVEPEEGARPLTVTLRAYTISGEDLPEGTYTWSIDGVEESGPKSTHSQHHCVLSTVGIHTVTLTLTLAGMTAPIGCTTHAQRSEGQAVVRPMICGYVRDDGGSAVEGVTVSANNGGGTKVTNADGRYELHVPYEWSGTITAQHVGYTFAPADRPYSGVTSDFSDQDFVASVKTVTISGVVRDANGAAVDGITIVADNDGGTKVTDANGCYELSVLYGWSGTVSPQSEQTFDPASRSYSNLTSDAGNQDFAVASGLVHTIVISGQIRDASGAVIGGVTVSASNGGGTTQTDPQSGGYILSVPWNWSGVVTPQRQGWQFTPVNRSYNELTESPSGQDYTGTAEATGPDGPTANAGPDQLVTDSDENGTEAVTLNGSASTSGAGITSYAWEENQAQLATGATPSVSLSVGRHIITLTVTDSDGLTDTDTVVILVNTPGVPVAEDRTYQVIKDTSYSVLNTLALRTQNAGADYVEYTILSLPSHGQLSDDTTGESITSAPYVLSNHRVKYVPTPGTAVGSSDTFTWKASDGTNESNVGTATVNVVAWSPPIGIPTPTFGLAETAPAWPTAWPSQPSPGNYYIDNTHPQATDTNNPYGCPDKPRATLPEWPAHMYLAAGSLVEIHGGPYVKGSFDTTVRNDAENPPTAESPAFIRGVGVDSMPTIQSRFDLQSITYVVMEYLDFNGGISNAIGAVGSTHHVAIRNCLFRNRGDAAGATSAVSFVPGFNESIHDMVVYNCNFHDLGNWEREDDIDFHGIAPTLWGRDETSEEYNVWILDNEFHHVSGNAVQVNAGNWTNSYAYLHHVYIGRNTGHHNRQAAFWSKQSSDTIMSQNRAYGGRVHGPQCGDGIGFQYNPTNLWIIYNEIHDNNFGIRQSDTSGGDQSHTAYIVGNVIYDIHPKEGSTYNPNDAWRAGVAISLWSGSQSRYIVNNTIHDVHGGIQAIHAGPIEISNNVISSIHIEDRHIDIAQSATAAMTNIDHVLFDQSGGPIRISWAGWLYTTLDAFLVDHPFEGCSEGDPLFVGTGSRDYRVLPGSPAIDTGQAHDAYQIFLDRYGIDIRKDRDGTSRPQGDQWDRGALEYISQ